jgi:hypothetical protein
MGVRPLSLRACTAGGGGGAGVVAGGGGAAVVVAAAEAICSDAGHDSGSAPPLSAAQLITKANKNTPATGADIRAGKLASADRRYAGRNLHHSWRSRLARYQAGRSIARRYASTPSAANPRPKPDRRERLSLSRR